jgi:hypothetical protein
VTHNLNANGVIVQCWSNDASPVLMNPNSITVNSVNQCTVDWNNISVAGRCCVVKCG